MPCLAAMPAHLAASKCSPGPEAATITSSPDQDVEPTSPKLAARFGSLNIPLVPNPCGQHAVPPASHTFHCECPGCGSVVTLANTPVGPAGASCLRCRRRFCTKCKLIWSAGHKCDVAQALIHYREQLVTQLEFDEYAEPLGLKQCPGCDNACEKSDPDECDHMKCFSCRKEFCWTCLADRTVILHHGNHYHRPDCRFFTPYDGVPTMEPGCEICAATGKPCEPPKLLKGLAT